MENQYKTFILTNKVNDEVGRCIDTFSWFHVLSDTYSLEQNFFYVKNTDDKIVAILHTYISKTTRGEKILFSSREGMKIADPRATTILTDAVKKFALNNDIIKVEIASGMKIPNLNCSYFEKYTFQIDLSPDANFLWKSMRDKTRNAIRKGEKHDLKVVKGHHLLKIFYRIYSDRMIKKLIPYFPYTFFKSLIKNFGSQCKIYTAFYDNKPISSMIIICCSSKAFYSYSGMLSGYERYCPNQFLLWQVIQDCQKNKINLIDLGESKIGSGVYKFKKWFGGVPKTIYYYDLIKKSNEKNKETLPCKPSPLARFYQFFLKNSPDFFKKILLNKMKQYGRLI